ncbi:MAG TPA: hypothetical protein VJB18_03320 [Burkholderiales bacterium]|nr:hypothetical protein [Burkholderiales bacterium]
MKFHLRRAATALFVVASGVSTLAHAASVSGQGTWETTLQGRDLDGSLSTFEAYYDTSLNITWLANANYAGAVMNWTNANVWAAALNPYGSGITGWRLPTVTDTGTSGCNFAYTGTDCGYNVDTATGEMAHMFYTTLGDKAYYNTSGIAPQAGWGLTNTGPFSNVQSHDYWSATEYAPNTSYAWYFITATATRTTTLIPIAFMPGLFTRAMSARPPFRYPLLSGYSAAAWQDSSV